MASTDDDLDIGPILREARLSVGISLERMARATHYAKSTLGHVETGRRTATAGIIEAYERTIEQEGGEVFRRDITHPGLIKLKGAKIALLTKAIREGDPDIIAKAPTAHATDLAIVHKADPDAFANLRRWMVEGKTATLRTNALSILAKTPGQENARAVIEVLETDEKVRHLCISSEVSRLLQLDWATSRRVARDLPSCPQPRKLAKKLAREVVDPHDSESRWCGAHMLGKLAPVLGR
ncbi:helix-turn-helix transcriptional regulator [Saccharopolyspora erythraea]|uniref:helix-turn-helix domain-containing protein n=1 Tax=Saccharopolyspora erythraea TaxID=1836 RepID=UPI001BABFFA7|nr:helix-turn-helix transcriptional regulator [Saccharopolyspora erythraea]QUH01437.1 helix-turn-helix transcriptional regulator [Saccharopolyspora erythraea]